MLQRIAEDPGMFQSQQLWLRHAIEGARGGDPEALKLARSKLPGAVRERDLWKAGEVVSEFAEETFPATPGYEDTLGRVVGEGLGSLASGVATSIVTGPAGGAVFFTAMGMGEAAERAASEGATDEQIIEAAGLGGGAGATDVFPAEMLLGRIPGANAVAHAVKKFGGARVMQALGRVSNQAIVESAQEGGQQAIQNLIAREVYKPEQQIGEGIVENMGVGGLVGGIAGLGREGVVAIGRRRSRSSRGERSRAVQDVPPPSPADEASPIPTADIVEGRERVADAEAAGRANEYLKVAGLPQVGQPVRVSRGRDVVEGVVTDAWDSDGEPGFTVESPDGTLTEGTLSTFANMGAEITGLPMPAPRAEIEKAAQDFAKEIDKLEQGAAKTMASEGQGPGPAPRLTRAQVVEVERLTRAGVPPGDAVVQVFSRAGAPPGDPYTPVTPTAEGFGGRPAPTVRGVAGTARRRRLLSGNRREGRR